MTTVTGTLKKANGTPETGTVTFYPVDPQRRRLWNYFDSTGSYVDEFQADLDGTGSYSVTLPAQAGSSPDGGRILRVHGQSALQLIVPVSGTVNERDIRADFLDAVAPSALTSIIDRSEVTSGTSPLTVQFTSLTAIPNSLVTVPDLAQSVRLCGHGPCKPSATGGFALVIGPAASTALGTQLDTHWMYAPSVNIDLTGSPEVLLDPHSPGDYQLYFYGVSGTILFDVSPATTGSLTAYAV